MAIKLGDAIVFIQGDKSGLDKSLGDSEKQTQGWASRLGGSVKTLVGGAIVGGVTVAAGAIVGAGAVALQTAGQISQSQNDLQAQLGLTEERAKELGEVALNVFKDNFGESIGDATAAVIEARSQLGDLTDNELQAATENAFRLADAFGVDVGESLSTARTLMSEFGLTQQEAFDFMAKGFQSGLDASGDFLDTVGEYSNLFAQAGGDVDQFFSLMETGLAGGVLGTDKAADAFKEFTIRLVDGSKTTTEATRTLFGGYTDLTDEIEKSTKEVSKLEKELDKAANAKTPDPEKIAELTSELNTQRSVLASLEEDNGKFVEGIVDFSGGVDSLYQQIKNGSLSSVDAFSMINDAVAGIEDPLERNKIGVALFGTQFEDLGADAMANIDLATTSLEDMAGATDKLDKQYDNLGSMFEGLKRRAMVSLAPIGEKLLELANKAMPYVEKAFAWFEEKVPIILDNLITFIETSVMPVLGTLAGWFTSDAIPVISSFVDFIAKQLIPILKAIGQYFYFTALDGDYLNDFLTHVPDFLQPILEIFGRLIAFLVEEAIPTLGELATWIIENVIPALSTFGTWLIQEGFPAVVAFVGPILEQLIPGLIQLATWIGDIASFIFPILVDVIQFIATTIFPILAEAIQFVVDHFNIFGPILAVIGGLILALTSPITLIIGAIILLATAWANNWGGIQEKTQAVLTFIQNIIQVVMTAILGFWSVWGDEIMALVDFVWTTIQTVIQSILSIVTFDIQSFIALIRGIWQAFGDAILGIWRAAWDGVSTILSSAATLLVTAVQNLRDDIIAIWDGIKDTFKNIGDSIVSGIKQGIEDAWDSLVSWFEERINDLVNSITDIIGIDSPSRVFANIGRNIMSGLALGIEQEEHMPRTAMTQAITNVTNNFYQNVTTSYLGNTTGEFQQARALLST